MKHLSGLAPSDWANLAPDAAMAGLSTTRAGLTSSETDARLKRGGPNTLPQVARAPWYLVLGREFIHFFALLLWAGAALAWLAGMPQLTGAIVAVILINGLFSFWQQNRAERAVEALQALLPRQVTVRRDGEDRLVGTASVVPGDLLVLTEGVAIPADARVIEAEHLRIDLSALTGESRPRSRTVKAPSAPVPLAADLPNLVFAGSTVASGRGVAVVYATAGHTEFGRIARLTQSQSERPSPLQIEVARVVRIVTVLAVGLGVTFFVLGTAVAGLTPAVGFLFAIGLIVANVPEGLLPTLTLSLALGVKRMAARNALVKRLSAVEALGATTVILTDKTGTLTENQMTVRQSWCGGVTYTVGGVGYEPIGTVSALPAVREDSTELWDLLRKAALCCDAHLVPPAEDHPNWGVLGDPTEAALLVAAAKVGLTRERLDAWPRLGEVPFDSVRKRMTTVVRVDDALIACVKGAPSTVLERSTTIRWGGVDVPFDEALRDQARASADALAGRGLRLLAVATRPVGEEMRDDDGWRMDEVEANLTLLGLVAMEDPPRPEVPAALAACHRAGIRVVMITGDSGLTAQAIGREIGLHPGAVRVVSGVELESLHDSALDTLLDVPQLLFARVSPEHKLRMVEAFQRRGEVVAVTGDGVNDAPALKRADVGVAMGIVGTDVAREAADVVLTDDNFASIVAAIEEGRAVFDNIQKFVTYVFASNSAEAVPFVAFMLFNVPLPLTVMQVLAVDLGTDMLPALALGMEPPEPGVMQRPPRNRHEPLLTKGQLVRAYAWFGLIEATFGLSGYFLVQWLAGWRPGLSLADSGPVYLVATTMTLAGIVAGQVGAAFACRSPRQSVFRLGFTANRALLLAIGAELALLLALIYVPPLAAVFGLAPLSATHWFLLAAFPPTLLLLEEARKALRRRQARR